MQQGRFPDRRPGQLTHRELFNGRNSMKIPLITPNSLRTWIAELEREAVRIGTWKRAGAAELAREYAEASSELRRLAGAAA